MEPKLINRPEYINKLRIFKDNDSIKVITGVRGSGKSSILKLFQKDLIEHGIEENQILEINFEIFKYSNWKLEDFYEFVEDYINKLDGKKLYLFLDEVQNLKDWEKAVNSFRVEFNCDIYLTGSDAYLMSSNLTTLLSGRTTTLHVLPLSFKEFLTFNGLKYEKDNRKFILKKWKVTDKDNNAYNLDNLFDFYLKFGGFPRLSKFEFDEFQIKTELNELIDSIIIKDVLIARLTSSKRSISNRRKLSTFLSHLAVNNGKLISINQIVTSLDSLEERKNKNNYRTVSNYLDALLDAFIFYPVRQYNIKGRKFLQTTQKYYCVDTGLRNFLVKSAEQDIEFQIENIVFLELLRNGYDLSVGRVKDREIDFIAIKNDTKYFIQVTESIEKEDTLSRELKPFDNLKEIGHKILIVKNETEKRTIRDVQVIPLADFLLEGFNLYN